MVRFTVPEGLTSLFYPQSKPMGTEATEYLRDSLRQVIRQPALDTV